jgi:hypothetical protein
MKINLIAGLLATGAVALYSTGCKEDEPKPASVGFEVADMEVAESDGTLKSFHPYYGIDNSTGTTYDIKITLDKPARETSIISYSLAGTASKIFAAGSPPDYDIETDNVTIQKGESEAILKVTIFEDANPEVEEVDANNIHVEDIVITLTEVVSGSVVLGEQTVFTLRIIEDDLIVFLGWDPQDQAGDDGGDVDMDLFAWLDGELFDYSINRDFDPEYVIIFGGYPSGTYSFSYTYYEGQSADLSFYSMIFGNVGGTNYAYPDDPLVTEGTYTLANKNTYPEDGEIPNVKIVQSLTKSGTTFSNVSEINEPVDGSSRIGERSMNKLLFGVSSSAKSNKKLDIQ